MAEVHVRVRLMGGIGQRSMMLVGKRKLRRIMETDLANLARLLEARN